MNRNSIITATQIEAKVCDVCKPLIKLWRRRFGERMRVGAVLDELVRRQFQNTKLPKSLGASEGPREEWSDIAADFMCMVKFTGTEFGWFWGESSDADGWHVFTWRDGIETKSRPATEGEIEQQRERCVK